jgi:hypothetical protein
VQRVDVIQARLRRGVLDNHSPHNATVIARQYLQVDPHVCQLQYRDMG